MLPPADVNRVMITPAAGACDELSGHTWGADTVHPCGASGVFLVRPWAQFVLRSQAVYLGSSEDLPLLRGAAVHCCSVIGMCVCFLRIPSSLGVRTKRTFCGADLCVFVCLFTSNNKICQMKFFPCSEEITVILRWMEGLLIGSGVIEPSSEMLLRSCPCCYWSRWLQEWGEPGRCVRSL